MELKSMITGRAPLPGTTSEGGDKRAQILMIFAVLTIVGGVFTPGVPTSANDTLARVPVEGGLEFAKSDKIRMLEEVLEISLRSIRIKYRFLNESDQDVHSTVAFPLPLRDTSHTGPAGSVKEAEEAFSVRVNDDPAPTTRIGNAETWRQSFPAGKETVVEHSYTPAASGEYDYLYQDEVGYTYGLLHKLFFRLTLPGRASEACVDGDTARAVKNRLEAYARNGGSVAVFARDIEYVLGTGRNWKGPIGKFVLRIVKESPDHFVALCFPGSPKKVSPTVSEYVETDFVPPDKLVVYFYSVGERFQTE
jgi:hypothetical protein